MKRIVVVFAVIVLGFGGTVAMAQGGMSGANPTGKGKAAHESKPIRGKSEAGSNQFQGKLNRLEAALKKAEDAEKPDPKKIDNIKHLIAQVEKQIQDQKSGTANKPMAQGGNSNPGMQGNGMQGGQGMGGMGQGGMGQGMGGMGRGMGGMGRGMGGMRPGGMGGMGQGGMRPGGMGQGMGGRGPQGGQ